MVDSKADGCLSRFVPSKQKDVLRFTIDAFLFQKKLSRKHEVTELYMHCVMAVAPAKATPGTKSCTYNREAKRWEELYGDHEVCTCCESRCAGSQDEGGSGSLLPCGSEGLGRVSRLKGPQAEQAPGGLQRTTCFRPNTGTK
ncbi:zona pellucida sperm-binding protein 3-like [Lepisosteus oculatus]|uniref:zona pellucida sperm-binding protein 3-like n=1 Tax=Lepisosteus oculatus TaxID=7918 RepID=UPI0037249EBE